VEEVVVVTTQELQLEMVDKVAVVVDRAIILEEMLEQTHGLKHMRECILLVQLTDRVLVKTPDQVVEVLAELVVVKVVLVDLVLLYLSMKLVHLNIKIQRPQLVDKYIILQLKQFMYLEQLDH
jgi:hypothetical protein